MRYMILFGGENFEMKEIRYYISDDGRFRADNPEEVIKYEEETERQLKEELQQMADFYRAEEIGYVGIINNQIELTYFGLGNPQVLKHMKSRLDNLCAAFSNSYGYIVDKKDINTKIYEVNKR